MDPETLGAYDAGAAKFAKDWHAQPVVATRTSAITKMPVLTASGRAIGDVRDILLDEHGTLNSLEISSGGLLRRRSTVSNRPGLTIGSDAVLIPEDEVALDRQD